MTNKDIGAVLEEIGALLEIKQDNAFKVRSYQRAAETIARCGLDIRPNTPIDALTALSGVGAGIAAAVIEIASRGSSDLRDSLLTELPVGLLDILKVQGVGPKRAGLFWRELGISDLDSLENAASTGLLAELPKMGAKSQQKILDNIALVRCLVGRMLLSEAHGLAETIIAALPPECEPQAAGSLRRGKETVGDIDVLTIDVANTPATEAFLNMPNVLEVLRRGDTRSSVLLVGGIQADLRVVPAESYGAALQYFTGSQQHNIQVRERAVARGLKVSEYGVFQGELRLAGATEAEVYAALDLAWIPPELREDGGELSAAEAGTLPDLVQLCDMRGDLQMHSTWSDGANSIEEMARAAAALGYAYIAITDHSKALTVANGLDEARLIEQVDEICALSARGVGIRVLAGCEVDVLSDGGLDIADEVLFELDFVIASVHSGLSDARDKMTRRVIRAVEHPSVRMLAHPTGRVIGQREGADLDLPAVIDACVATGTAIEINCGPSRLDLRDAHARMAIDRGALLCINTDAHTTAGLSWMRYGVSTARRGWVESKHVLNARPLDSFLDWLSLG